jgi:glutamate/tyrosine decarboxylase-like PLP-dependent enzyme
MRLPGNSEQCGLNVEAQYANPFNAPPSLDMANMRGLRRGGLQETVDLLRGYAQLASVNLVDRGLNFNEIVQGQLIEEVTNIVVPDSERLKSGIVETSGSHANEKALRLAKRATGRNKIICSTLTHSSIVDAARDLEMELQVLSVDAETMQMDEGTLLAAIDDDLAVLVLTAGTTTLGLVEKLPASVEEKLKECGVRLHVDAAYGGLNIGLQSNGALIDSDVISSITVDTHKFVAPMGCSVLLLDESDVQQENAYLSGASWLSGTTQGAFVPYMALRNLQGFGRDRLREFADQNLNAARVFERALKEAGVSTIVPVSSGVVPVRLDSFEQAQYLYEALVSIGFNVPKPFRIETDDGDVYGVRFVFTSDVYYDSMYLRHDLAPMVVDIIKSFNGTA